LLERAIGRLALERGTSRLAEALVKFVDEAIERARGGDVSELVHNARAQLLRSLFQILRIDDPSRTEYLSPLIDLVRKQGSLTIATLNYDRSVENVAEAAGEPYDTGIETWLESGVLDWPEKGFGSSNSTRIDWSSNVQISSASFRSSASAKSLARMRMLFMTRRLWFLAKLASFGRRARSSNYCSPRHHNCGTRTVS
jgi:hypothetical protein